MPDSGVLLAQAPPTSVYPIIGLWACIILFFYLMVIRPQGKRTKEHKDLMEALQKGDRIITAGGIHGTIVRTNADIIHVDIGKGVVIRLDRSAIRRREGEEEV